MISVQRLDRCTVLPGRSGLVALGVGGVLERHPAVAGLGQGAHHPAVEVARPDLPDEPALGLGRAVGRVERLAPQVGQLGHVVRVDQRPHLVGLDPAHELVRDPVGQVEVVRAAGVLAGVVAQLEELLDVGVPRLEVDAGGALAPAALVDRGDRGVERAQPRDDAVGLAVGAADQRAARSGPATRRCRCRRRTWTAWRPARSGRRSSRARRAGSRRGSRRTSGCAGCRS